MDRQPFDNLLKITLPRRSGPAKSLPTLTADQVKQIPPKLLDLLFDLGQSQDLGDLTILTIEDEQDHASIQRAVQWIAYGARADFLHNDGIEIVPKDNDQDPVPYGCAEHEDDIALVATDATHKRFLERLNLYVFSVHADLADFQAHLCEDICTRFPVYEAEIMALLSKLSENGFDSWQEIEPQLARFVSKRTKCLRDTLVGNASLLPILRAGISTKERFMAVVQHADDDVVEAAMAEICEAIGDRVETQALLDTYVGNHPADTEVNVTLPIPVTAHATASLQRRHRVARPPKADVTYTKHGRAPMVLRQPQNGGEFWSITPEQWESLPLDRKKTYTQAGIMCETVTGTEAPQPCSQCRTGGHALCDVYTDDRRNAHAGKTCARCRIDKRQCSMAIRSKFRTSRVETRPDTPVIDYSRSTTPSSSTSDDERPERPERRPRPLTAYFGPPSGTLDMARVRPEVKGHYWSVPQHRWDRLHDGEKRAYTHAGHICETVAGMKAPESCGSCPARHELCEIYTEHELNGNAGEKCARCRVTGRKCSLVVDDRRVSSANARSGAQEPGQSISSTAPTLTSSSARSAFQPEHGDHRRPRPDSADFSYKTGMDTTKPQTRRLKRPRLDDSLYTGQ